MSILQSQIVWHLLFAVMLEQLHWFVTSPVGLVNLVTLEDIVFSRTLYKPLQYLVHQFRIAFYKVTTATFSSW